MVNTLCRLCGDCVEAVKHHLILQYYSAIGRFSCLNPSLAEHDIPCLSVDPDQLAFEGAN